MRSALIAVFLTVAFLPTDVSAAINCRFQEAPAVAFGPYDVFSPIATTATSTLIFRCTGIGNGTSVVAVSLSPGNSNNAQTRTLRELAGGSDVLNYNIFSDPGHTQIWGGGSSGHAPVVVSVANNNTEILTMYGLIPAQQNAGMGRYGDSLSVTLNF